MAYPTTPASIKGYVSVSIDGVKSSLGLFNIYDPEKGEFQSDQSFAIDDFIPENCIMPFNSVITFSTGDYIDSTEDYVSEGGRIKGKLVKCCKSDGSVYGSVKVSTYYVTYKDSFASALGLSFNKDTGTYELSGLVGWDRETSGVSYIRWSTVHVRNLITQPDYWGYGIEIYDEDPGNDPYAGGGTSGTGGGTGTFSGTGDSIDFPGLPTLSAVSTGFITLFNPSIAQMQSLANYMWSDLFDLDTFKKIFADPMDCILGLSIVPVAVPNGGTAEVKVGNISTGVSMTVASTQYVEVDCGTLNVQEYWGSYLDYDPYTKAEIYLPYCGTHPIAVDDIMGKSVHVKYHVDILSGACVAYVKCGSSVLYSFIGQCTSSIPITGNDWTNVVNGAISIASAIGSMVATGGATAPLVLPGVASTAVNNLKPSVEKSGSMSGTGGMLAVQTPYLILTRPRQALPKNQNTYTGYPSFIKEKLSDLKGYTEVAEIRLSGVDATDAELDEIVGLLKGGVII